MPKKYYKGTQPSPYKKFLANVRLNGGDLNATFITSADLVNKIYSERWQLTTLSTRGLTTDLKRLYNLELSYENTQMLLKVFKYWAKTMAAGTTESRMGVICKLISKYGFQIISDSPFLKGSYAQLTTSHKKNLNYIFLVLHDIFLNKEFETQRDWCKENLPDEKVNPHDPVNGAYSDTEFNAHIDRALIDVSFNRSKWLAKKQDTTFLAYSAAICRTIALISSRRGAQLCQCKVCDLSEYGINNDDIQIDQKLISILFHKSKINDAGFRSKPEGDFFPFSEVFSQIIINYLVDYKALIKSYCDTLKTVFKQVPWECLPLFPDLLSIKSKNDLILPNMHSDLLHRNLAGNMGSATFSINRVRHTTITRGTELDLNNAALARLTGVTIPAVKNYKDLTKQSRHLINELFSKCNLLDISFKWTRQDYNEHFAKTYTDEFGREIGGVKKDTGCSGCTKKLGAPLGCYACGADLFIPFIEADHQSQLIKAQAKQGFLEKVGSNHHQLFEIKAIIKRILAVIHLQKEQLVIVGDSLDEQV
ncbi:hypothetical protein FGD67_19100 [Colwellia sp. M166]|uniref:hypothetical protein n=1 Tax=Colwellia sp. M166 TaxID=2583805 RepID=UPI00211EB766|nr:hypothetical protein [Colwellia sp. M166]UUO25082.1 hypothetical protein FGD67_19100 [Colwellia sp. M166]|tara:strand:+ start:91 stop:1695 length:1605 start_codon:yes stop_codon:yes gene_type:complete